jgi:hypothetical protein
MNTQKSIYNKLFKEESTELASHKVELGIYEDAQKAYKTAIADRKKANDEIFRVKTAVANATKNMVGYVKSNQLAASAFDKLVADIKSLGISIPPEVQAQQKNIQEGLAGSLAAYKKSLDGIKLP